MLGGVSVLIALTAGTNSPFGGTTDEGCQEDVTKNDIRLDLDAVLQTKKHSADGTLHVSVTDYGPPPPFCRKM